MDVFSATRLAQAADQAGLVFPHHTLAELVAALDSGKHVILTGAPGTGKTTLAYLAAEVAREAVLCSGFLAVTASSEWATSHTIGEYVVTPDGPVFRAGVFLEAIKSGQWLVVDELNRSQFDRAFGPLFTVLSGQPVTLPFKEPGHPLPISIVPAGVEPPEQTEPIKVPQPWRMIATMNVFDKDLLFRLSYALMRRFAFVEVESPPNDVIEKLLQGPGEIVTDLLAVRRFIDLGPAIFLDAAKYATRRARDGDVSRSRLLYEVFYSFLLPQLDGLGDADARVLFDVLAPLFDAPELHNLRRVVRTVLGDAVPSGLAV